MSHPVIKPESRKSSGPDDLMDFRTLDVKTVLFVLAVWLLSLPAQAQMDPPGGVPPPTEYTFPAQPPAPMQSIFESAVPGADMLRERRGMDAHSELGQDLQGPGGSAGPGTSLGTIGPGGTTGGHDPRAEDPSSPTRSRDLNPRDDIPGLKPHGYDDTPRDPGY